ncbi:MAG: site-specific integrase [Akkermansiaceae bacterium]|nr:site-specific integrase [Akkermansiaceae bacterium]
MAKKSSSLDLKYTYDSSSKKLVCRWTCPLKKAMGKSSRYSTKEETVTPNEGESFKSAIARTKVVLAEIAKEKIRLAEIQKQEWLRKNKPEKASNAKIYASEYLRNLPDSKICNGSKYKSRDSARKYVNCFANWLAENIGEDLQLHQIEKEHCIQWVYYLSEKKKYAFSSVDTMKRSVQACFEIIEEDFKDAPYKYRNHFKKIRTKKIGLDNTFVPRKEIFSAEQLEYILKRAGEGRNHNKKMKLHTFAYFYFLMVTGWRDAVIAELKWIDIDLKHNIITKIHNKTENSTQQRTRIYITPTMKWILEEVKKLPAPKKWKEYVFCYGRENTNNLIQSNVTKAQTHMRAMRKEMELNVTNKPGIYELNPYAVHSIRGSMISLLKGAGNFNNDLVEYIVGHSGDSVSENNYERFDDNPELYTRDALEFMEAMIGADKCFIWHVMPSEMAQRRLDCEMPNGWQRKLSVNFWDPKAIELMENYFSELKKSKNHTAAKLVNEIIMRANDMRNDTGLSKVTVSLVQSLLPTKCS